MEQRFFFLINFSVSLLLFGYCLIFIFDTKAFYFSMFYFFSVVGAFIGSRINPQPTRFRTANLITGIVFPPIIAAIILILSGLSVKTTFFRLVVFTTLAIVGIGINFYLYYRFRRKRNS